MEFYSDLVFDSDSLPGGARQLSSAMMRGKGQYVLAKEMILVSSEKVTEISDRHLAIKIDGKTIKFILSKTTKICDGSKILNVNEINKGDMVTIASRITTLTKKDQYTALSVRKGPMIFGAWGNPSLKKYRCDE